MFTFVAITYNHEKYIIEHLESIKYQIENFSKGKQVNLVISDDGSMDNTMLYAQQWIERNKYL
ncbi:glycosyltransferase, partial [uncultured Trichococcus sp.]